MNAKEVIKILEANGFYKLRQKGSHARYSNGDKFATVPIHGKKDIRLGTLKAIEKESGVKLK